ncbi:MAG TPA: FkbM family methyltransferase [Fulvivirga sp.]|nr:FkbM family methyltransferase [Fulvivirga sp.]
MSIIWDPYQKFWNDSLLSILKKIFPKRLHGHIRLFIRGIDTIILSFTSKRRINKRTIKYTLDELNSININYFDIGTHKKASELKWITNELFAPYKLNYKAFAFEAMPEFAVEAGAVFEKNHKIKFYNLALSDEIPTNGTIKFYVGGDGLGNSFYKNQQTQVINVPVSKLSDIIMNEGIKLKGSINILRMNIEGAEYNVMMDLINSNLCNYFSGFYGMWDDVKKMPGNKEKAFRLLLKDNNIEHLTFNGRDMKSSKRKRLILNDIKSVLMAGPKIEME